MQLPTKWYVRTKCGYLQPSTINLTISAPAIAWLYSDIYISVNMKRR